MSPAAIRVAIIGAGWAGLATAWQLAQSGARVSLFEAGPRAGGRARNVELDLPGSGPVCLDNGQHILIGAYDQCLRLMSAVGIDPADALLAQPLNLRFPDGTGLALPAWPPPWAGLLAVLGNRRWSWRSRWALLGALRKWQGQNFRCPPETTVADLCTALPDEVVRESLQPLCVAALNTPMTLASARVFLRVLQDSLFAGREQAQLLLPRRAMGDLFPEAAVHHLHRAQVKLHFNTPVRTILQRESGWEILGQVHDTVILATSAPAAARLLTQNAGQALTAARNMRAWAEQAAAISHRTITTVFARTSSTPGQRLPAPMLALHEGPQAPAQFVFDRSALQADLPPDILAFVISDSCASREQIETDVRQQARSQLGLDVTPLQTISERRATFSCTPELLRPGPQIAPGLLACGDYVDGPYPATLEGAVRSGLAAARRALQ